MTVRASSRLGTAKGSGEVAAIVRAHCEPLPSVDEADAFGKAVLTQGGCNLVAGMAGANDQNGFFGHALRRS